MKCPVHKAVAGSPKGARSSGFTLIELLVVIAIIAVIAALLLPAISSSITKAEKARAQTEMSQLVASIKAYYGDYGKMPVAPGDNGAGDKTYGAKGKSATQNIVMDILRGKDSTGNPKGTVFLDVPKDSMEGTDKDGNSYVEADGYYLDPWGNPYVISMDTDFNGGTTVGGAPNLLDVLPAGSAPQATMTATSYVAAVVSYGPDPSTTKSFITSWGRN